MISAAVFDLDGILVDTEYLQFRGWQEVLKTHGILLKEDEYRKYAGHSGNAIANKIVKTRRLAVTAGILLEQRTEWIMQWFRNNNIPLMPYVREAINYFLSKGISMAVASGGSREEVELKLHKTGIRDFFHSVVSGDDVSYGKPHPDIYCVVAASLGMRPDHCVAFEDTQYGVEAAIGAGMQCIAIPTLFSSKQDFTKAHIVCSGMKDAIECCADLLTKT